MGTINLVLLDVEMYCIGSGLGLMLFFNLTILFSESENG